jgi:hypothetical protein
VATATALLTLGNPALVAWIPGLDTGFVGGALDLSLAEQPAVNIPLAVVAVGSAMVLLAASGWIGRWWSRAVTLQYAALPSRRWRSFRYPRAGISLIGHELATCRAMSSARSG